MSDKSTSGIKIITINRKASFNFFFKEILEAGIVLKGSEIKSVRDGKVNIAESYAVEKEGEIFLINSHIPIYKQASYSNHNPYSEHNLGATFAVTLIVPTPPLLLNSKALSSFPVSWIKSLPIFSFC